MGLMFAICVGGGLAYVVDMLNDSVRTNSELYELLGLPVLASVNRIMTPTEMRLKKVKQNITVLGLIVYIVVSRFLVKLIMVGL
jgi:hypothetical protein